MRSTAGLAAGWRITSFASFGPEMLWEPPRPLRPGARRIRDYLGGTPKIQRHIVPAIRRRWRGHDWRRLMRRHRYDVIAMLKELKAENDGLAGDPFQGWPMVGADGQWITRDEFFATHARTRQRVRRISAGEAAGIARALAAPRQRLEDARQQHAAERERTGIIRLPLPGWGTLESHLAYLFLLSGPLWKRFRACTGCDDAFWIDGTGKGGNRCPACYMRQRREEEEGQIATCYLNALRQMPPKEAEDWTARRCGLPTDEVRRVVERAVRREERARRASAH